ncbi:MAG TPA: post-COAP-1 domain-containing protein, partial [Thermoanaerobaculia bacterium]
CPDDGNVCTQDVCNPETGGCGVVLAGQSCADGDLCDGTETCNSAGTCVAGTPVVCQDTNACTDDVCDPATGQCSFVNDNTNQCSDGLFCTVNDRCENGACVSTPRNCGDANACTPDTCDETNDTCVNGPVPQETCDGADNDCDGKIDEGFPRAKMTGGGQILVGSSKRTFGFNAKGTVGGKDKGEFNYVNHTTKNHIKGEVTQIFFQCDCESMFRVRTRDGCYYVVTADDNGEPGKGNDRFGLEYEPENPSYCPKETTGGPKPLSAGNIQCHAHHDADEDDDDHGDCEKPDENDKKDHNHRR